MISNKSGAWQLRLGLLFIGCWAFAAFQTAAAEVVNNLSQVAYRVDVNERQPTHRQITAGLEAVVVRLTGRESSLQDPVVKILLAEADVYVSSVQYADRSYVGEEARGRVLTITFDQAAVIAQLKAAELPIWSVDRPRVLFWWGDMDGDQSLRILQAEDADPLGVALQDQAYLRGLPIQLPLMDLQDQQWVDETALMTFAQSELAQASERYQPQVWVAGVSEMNATGGWQARWMHSVREEVGSSSAVQWHEVTAETQQALMPRVVDKVTEVLAQALLPSEGLSAPEGASVAVGMTQLVVDGVTRFSEYQAIAAYLQRLNGVQKLQLDSLEDKQLSLVVQLSITVEQLNQRLMQDQKLTLSDSSANRLFYQWRSDEGYP